MAAKKTERESEAAFLREAAAIRKQKHTLMRRYGACLNTWPQAARDEYERLDRRMRVLEGTAVC